MIRLEKALTTQKVTMDPEEVPLGDVFANPAPTESNKKDFTEFPEPPPPPPTFDPFEN